MLVGISHTCPLQRVSVDRTPGWRLGSPAPWAVPAGSLCGFCWDTCEWLLGVSYPSTHLVNQLVGPVKNPGEAFVGIVLY